MEGEMNVYDEIFQDSVAVPSSGILSCGLFCPDDFVPRLPSTVVAHHFHALPIPLIAYHSRKYSNGLKTSSSSLLSSTTLVVFGTDVWKLARLPPRGGLLSPGCVVRPLFCTGAKPIRRGALVSSRCRDSKLLQFLKTARLSRSRLDPAGGVEPCEVTEAGADGVESSPGRESRLSELLRRGALGRKLIRVRELPFCEGDMVAGDRAYHRPILMGGCAERSFRAS